MPLPRNLWIYLYRSRYIRTTVTVFDTIHTTLDHCVVERGHAVPGHEAMNTK